MIDAARRGGPAPGVDHGDTVVILPDQYAGAVDLQKTPLGRIAGRLSSTWRWSAAPVEEMAEHHAPGGSALILLLAAVAAATGRFRFAAQRCFALILLGMAGRLLLWLWTSWPSSSAPA